MDGVRVHIIKYKTSSGNGRVWLQLSFRLLRSGGVKVCYLIFIFFLSFGYSRLLKTINSKKNDTWGKTIMSSSP